MRHWVGLLLATRPQRVGTRTLGVARGSVLEVGSSQYETDPNRKSAVSQAPAASTAISEAPGDGSSGQREEKAEAPRSPELSPCLQNGGSPPAQSR